MPDYGGSVGLMAELSVNYESGFSSTPIFGEPIPLEGTDVAPAGSTEFSTPVSPVGVDGMLTGSSSVFGIVDMADFVGPGLVDSLYVDLLIQDSADFMLSNATATAGLSFDVFDSDSGIDDAVIGVTYTYAPSAIPEPTALVSLAMLGCVVCLRRPRRATTN